MPREPQYCREEVADPRLFDKRSFRTVSPRKDVRIIIACLKGQWDEKRQRCKVGTRTVSILRKVGTPKCPVFKRTKKSLSELTAFEGMEILPVVFYGALGYLAYTGFKRIEERLTELKNKIEKQIAIEVR
ncbi:MAG: hypothetical protein QW156_05025 [Candidatus Aenigmatarchaeota archaeon]